MIIIISTVLPLSPISMLFCRWKTSLMHGQTFKTTLSEAGGKGRHFCDYDCVSIPGEEEISTRFWFVSTSLSGVVGLKAPPMKIEESVYVLYCIVFSCDGHILFSFVFPQCTSFHSVFHSFHGLMNSINWPALSLWVFIAQAGRALQRERRGHGFESRWSPENLFFGLFSQLLK